jgi:glycosyltransferase involved in cell wall biosynthesis
MATNTKVSVNILTYNRASLLMRAINSVRAQDFSDKEIIVVNNGSTDNTAEILKGLPDIKVITNPTPLGITQARQQALKASAGEYIAVLDDDDEWLDGQKLSKQADFLSRHSDYVLVGGGIKINYKQTQKNISPTVKFRPVSDKAIRRTMLFRNNFFTSTVMFRKQAAIEAGGFIKDEYDLAEDYDLWLRLGQKGKMYNFREPFTAYTQPNYNKERVDEFFKKQLKLININSGYYLFYYFARLVLQIRRLMKNYN